MSVTRLPLVVLAAAGIGLLAGCAGAPAPVTPAVPAVATSAPTSAASTPSAVPAQAGACTLDQLKGSLGQTTGEAGQRHTALVWTNTSTAPCTVSGFSGVDLQGPADPMGTTYSLPRSSVAPTSVRLGPGETAHTTITWLPPQDGPGWTPTGMLVTPPNETRSVVVGWPGGAVLRQDGATHPGTFIDPVRPGPQG